MKKKCKYHIIALTVLIAAISIVISSCKKESKEINIGVNSDNVEFKEVNINLNPDYNELFTKEEMKNYSSAIPQYTTDVSVGFKNKDGTNSLYVFSSPINFIKNNQFSLIDTRIKNVNDIDMRNKGYIYTIANSDIVSFYPKLLSKDCGIKIKKDSEYEFGILNETFPKYLNQNNFIDEEKNMLKYEDAFGDKIDMYVYPSSLGSNCEILFNKNTVSNVLTYWLKIPEGLYVNIEPGGYLVLNKDKVDDKGNKTTDILGVIQKPLLKDKNNNISYSNSIMINKKNDNLYELSFKLDQSMLNEGSRAFISFELRREKQPDNALYSKLPDFKNAYLRNYSVIGCSDDNGIGRLLIRYKFVKIFDLESSQIKKANYVTYSLTNNNKEYELLSVLEDWCSITGNWSKNYKTGNRTSFLNVKEKELNFDITEEVKKWCEDSDGQMEHNGVMLKSPVEIEGVYDVILSNDNSLYRVKTKIILN